MIREGNGPDPELAYVSPSFIGPKPTMSADEG